MRSHSRRRLYPTLPPSPLDSWCQRGLMALALSGGSAAALFLNHQPGWSLALSIVYPFLLIFGAFATRWMNFFALANKYHQSINQGFYLVMVVSFPFLAPQPSAPVWTLILLLCMHGYALRYARIDNFAVLALILPLFEVLLVHSVLWPGGMIARGISITWILATLLLAGGITTWIHARWSRRRLLQHDRSHHNPSESGTGLWDRARFMMLLGLLLFPIGLGLQQAALWTVPDPADSFTGTGMTSSGNGTGASADNSSIKEEKANVTDRKPPRDFVFPNAIKWQGKVTESKRESLLFQVRTEQDIDRSRPYYSDARPLYLTATTFDTISESGLSRGYSPEAIFHSNSGLGSDDWIVFDPDFQKNSVVQFKMKTRPLLHPDENGKGHLAFLLHDRRMVAMRYPSCRFDEDDHTALAEVPKAAMFEYQWLSQPVDKNTPLISSFRADPRYLILPSDPDFRTWTEEALQLCEDLNSSEQKVNRILQHFQGSYRYDLEPSTSDGIQAFRDFFELKRGYCTYFASAAMLYLRANGIACRVATGFMVTDYSKAREAYIGRLPGHAWVEVLLADGNWRVVEPTPATSRMDAIAAYRAERIAEDFPEEAQPQDATLLNLDPLAEAKKEGLAADVGDFVAFSRGIVVIAFGSLLSIVAFALWLGYFLNLLQKRRVRRTKEALFTTEAILAMDYWARIRSLLGDLGFQKKRSQTASEFAISVQFWGGDLYRPLGTITRLVYRTRFGGHVWSERECDFLDQFEDLLLAKAQQTHD